MKTLLKVLGYAVTLLFRTWLILLLSSMVCYSVASIYSGIRDVYDKRKLRVVGTIVRSEEI